MRLPNGFGNVSKLSGKRRKPWRARRTSGWEKNEATGRYKQLYQTIGYYETRQLALQALAEYNADPYDLHAATITVEEVYEKWSEAKFGEISKSNIQGYKAAWLLCEPIKNYKFIDIKIDHLQRIVDISEKNHPTLRKLKVLFKALFDYAVIHSIITKERHIVEYVNISKAGNPNSLDRKPFTRNEVEKIWNALDSNEYMSIVLMLIYTGVRVSELLDLTKENVDLEKRCFNVVESKTKAGIRVVPIADKVLPMFQKWMSENKCEYLVCAPGGRHFIYRNYYDSYWKPLIKILGMKHTPHDCRHTCVSFLTAAGVDERMIQKIVGHKGQNVTTAVYTHLETEELLREINKI